MTTIKLKSSDGEIFTTEIETVRCSVTISTMIDDLGFGGEKDDSIIPLANISASTLRRVLAWAKYHIDDKTPVEEISYWDSEFLKVDQGSLFHLISAANFLDIKGLMNVACKTVANMMAGKSTEEIRNIFNISDDHTPEEMETIAKEDSWNSDK